MYATQIKEKTFSRGASKGAKVLVTYFPTKGAVSFVGSVKGGYRAWKSAEEARMHAAMLLEGTAKHTKKEIQQLLDSMAAQLSFSVTDERLVFSGRVRTAHLPKLLRLIAECLIEPAFPDAELDVLKAREFSNLALVAQDTRLQASILLARELYPKNHPNYVDTTEESKAALSHITSDHLASKHGDILDRRSLVLSIAGDITMPKAVSMIEKSFKELPEADITFTPYKKAMPGSAKRTVTTITNKASIDYMIGMLTGITKTHKDYAALLLGIQVLGNRSGFSGRLMKTVREEEGLTYGVYSMLSGFENGADGYLYIWATFAPQLFQKGRESIMRQVTLITGKGVTDEETKKHRELYDARAKVQLSNSGAFAITAHNVVVDGLPLSYLDTFPKRVLKLSAKEVNQVLKKYLVPKRLSEAAAGPVEKNALTR